MPRQSIGNGPAQHRSSSNRRLAGRWFRTLPWLWLALMALTASADAIKLRLPHFEDGRHSYYQELLVESLRRAGHEVQVEQVPLPRHKRQYLALERGEVSLLWLLPSRERDQRHLRIHEPLTFGMIGQRVLLIPPGDAQLYAKVETLNDFRGLGLVAGMGSGWVDARIWQANRLAVLEHPGDWTQIYRLAASRQRGIDYFPRGAIEVLGEALEHPELEIEPRLLLDYHTDFYFYLHRSQAPLKPLIEAALAEARRSGLQQHLFNRYHQGIAERLKLSKRRVLDLVFAPD